MVLAFVAIVTIVISVALYFIATHGFALASDAGFSGITGTIVNTVYRRCACLAFFGCRVADLSCRLVAFVVASRRTLAASTANTVVTALSIAAVIIRCTEHRAVIFSTIVAVSIQGT